MPDRPEIVVIPDGTCTIDIERVSPGTPTFYTTRTGSTTVTFPETIDETTSYFVEVDPNSALPTRVTVAGTYELSALFSGDENADGNGNPRQFNLSAGSQVDLEVSAPEETGGGGGGTSGITVSDTPPADPSDGDLWFDTEEELGPSALPDGLSILNEGVAVADVESLDFVGPLVAATAMGPDGTVTISGLTVADAGSTQGVAGAVTTIDFTGAGVAATVTGATATVNIDGGGGGGGGGGSPARQFGGTPNANSTAETDLQTLAIPATVGANDIIRGVFDCTWANTSGAAVTFQPKVYIGTTAITSFTAFSVANGNTHRVRIQVEIAVQNPTNDLHTNVGLHAQGTSPNGIASGNPLSGRSNHVNVTTEDLSAGKNLRLTSTLGTAHADASNTPVTAWLEIVEAS